MKSVLISIQPKWVEKIASGKKTIEVRKTRPKLETPFKCYIYETMTKLISFHFDWGNLTQWQKTIINGRGRVVGEFICNKIDKYLCEEYEWGDGDVSLEYRIRTVEGEKTCLEYDEVREYGNEKPLYFWHITDLKIYDKPKELSKFIKPFKYDGDGLRCCTKEELEDIYEWDCETLFNNKYPNFDFENCKCEDCPKAKDFYRLKLAPQSWCYVESGV